MEGTSRFFSNHEKNSLNTLHLVDKNTLERNDYVQPTPSVAMQEDKLSETQSGLKVENDIRY